MGYLMLDYDEYVDNIDYWAGTEGVKLPQLAEEVRIRGYRPVCAQDFYADIFGEWLEEKREPRDYVTGEYAALALEIHYFTDKDGKTRSRAKRFTVTKELGELYSLIERSTDFCVVAPVSYAGRTRRNENARYMYALVVEVDGILGEQGLKNIIHTWKRDNLRLPEPTYMVCSGHGIHLYYCFQEPIPLFKNIFEQLTEAKKWLTEMLWHKYITDLHQKIQYEGITQPFRCVGTTGKEPGVVAMAFRIGEKLTIDQFNSFLPKHMRIDKIYHSELRLAQAKELYPEWYQQRVVEKQPRGTWKRQAGIYFNWIDKVIAGGRVGHRYHCLENLCALAVQCDIPPEILEADVRELAEYLETLTDDEKNHFTEHDIQCALKTYYDARKGEAREDRKKGDLRRIHNAYERNIDVIAAKTGIPLPRTKRNGRRQDIHLKMARSNQQIMDEAYGRDWREGNGRKSKKDAVEEWQRENPGRRKADCMRELGITRPTVMKYWQETSPKPSDHENE